MTRTAQQTLDHIRASVAEKQSATLVALTTLLDALAKKGEVVCLSDLASFVKGDTRLAARVLAEANTFAVKRSAMAVTSVPEAFHILGISRIRSSILASLLAQHADSSNQVQREMAVVSISSGLLAQTLAESLGEDREQAFLCGSLRHYGHLLLSTFFPAEFAEARAAALEWGREAEEFERVFGISPWDVTCELLTDLHMPRAMLDAIGKPPGVPAREYHANPLLNLAVGAASFTELLFDPRVPPDGFRDRAIDLMAQHAPNQIANHDELDGFLRQQKAQLGEFSRYIGCSALAQRPMLSISHRISNLPVARNSIVEARSSYQVATTGPDGHGPAERYHFSDEALARIAEEFHGTDVVLFAFEETTKSYRAGRGVGAFSERVLGMRVHSEGEDNLFRLCLTLKQVIAIHDRTDPTLQSHLPSWMKTSTAPMAFFLCPFGDHVITHVVMVGWREPRKVIPPAPIDLIRCANAVHYRPRAPDSDLKQA